jgi:hypothetical protein
LIQEQVDAWMWSEVVQSRKKFSLNSLNLISLAMHSLHARCRSNDFNGLQGSLGTGTQQLHNRLVFCAFALLPQAHNPVSLHREVLTIEPVIPFCLPDKA